MYGRTYAALSGSGRLSEKIAVVRTIDAFPAYTAVSDVILLLAQNKGVCHIYTSTYIRTAAE